VLFQQLLKQQLAEKISHGPIKKIARQLNCRAISLFSTPQ